jgi:hypothetical protein
LFIKDKGLSRPDEAKPANEAARLSDERLAQRTDSTTEDSDVPRAGLDNPKYHACDLHFK